MPRATGGQRGSEAGDSQSREQQTLAPFGGSGKLALSRSMPKDTRDRRQYMRKYQGAWLKARRQAWLDANGPCRKCGSSEKLEVDHVDPSTKVTHNVWSLSEAKRLAELAKCQVLCEKCHQKKSDEERRRTVTHGTITEYKFGCRCNLCTVANGVRQRLYFHGFTKTKLARLIA